MSAYQPRKIRFDLSDIQAFLAVVELGSFKAAADALHLSQPALSRRIKKLEDNLGLTLINRTTRSLYISSSGAEFYRKAARLMSDFDNLKHEMSALSEGYLGEVTVACIPSIAHYFLTTEIKTFNLEFPNIRINVIDCTTTDLLDNVKTGKSDFGIGFITTDDRDLLFNGIYRDKFVLICYKNHALSQRRAVQWEELHKYPFISLSLDASTNRVLIDNALMHIRKKPRVAYQTQHLTTLVNMVAEDLGISVVPDISLSETSHPNICKIPLNGPKLTRTIGLITRKSSVISPAAQNFLALIEKRLHML